MANKKKNMAGPGRGKKGTELLNDDSRPECHRCGGYMKSSGVKNWRCTTEGCATTRSKKLNVRMREEYGFLNTLGYDPASARAQEKYLRKRYKGGLRRFVVTSAQNNTQVFKPFLESLNRYCTHNDAELIVIPSSYTNMNAFITKADKSKFYDPIIEDYLIGEELILGGIKIKPDINITPTAANPLSGMHDIGGSFDCIYGHPQHARMQVGAPHDQRPKRLFTTGSVTKKNYGKSKAGGKAEFHHVCGAVVVECVKKSAFVRQINCDSKGRFQDLDKLYTPDGVQDGQRIDTLCPGDEHVLWNEVEDVTYSRKDSICNVLQPKYIVRHDVLDGYAGSHHHDKSPVTQFKKYHTGLADYRAEIDQCIAFINRTTPDYATSIIVPSNHHDHLEKWLNTANANKDHLNAILICELQKLVRESVLEGGTSDPFELYVKPRLECKNKFLDRNESWKRRGVDYSQHGDVGVNGARGSAAGLSRTTHKMTIAHSHSPGIVKGIFQVGTSTGTLEYERGLSTHSQTHCIQYPNGKRTLIDIIDNAWRLE